MIELKTPWPAGMTIDQAAAYTGLSKLCVIEAAKIGALTILKVGPNGKKICLRTDLDKLLQDVFAHPDADQLQDMDFADDE